MLRIGLTQRVDVIKEYGERRDALDQAWTGFLQVLEMVPVPIPNRLDARHLASLNLEGILLSGGNDLCAAPDPMMVAPERDRLEHALLDYAREEALPVLGVCRGLQMLNVYYGGRLRHVANHIARDHAVRIVSPFPGLRTGELTVNSFHQHGIAPEDLAGELVVTGLTSDGTIEAARHASLPQFGIMWHPERNHPVRAEDQAMLRQVFWGEQP